ncbi:microtubule-associated protein 4 isoform X3 [Xyrauchen texanus]|uniref:microtubule-associated protein 4 isoform X3 n=1 Tax=Xyrauchen texanus TaxID=154827 RepID=UPI0022423737|nr:microtubule-associated protein 4 isoform X3 [Xyrauchen texanus]
MADLSLTDALTDSVPQSDVENLVEKDFVATLEAECFDDQIGETVGKTDYIPLLDNDGKADPDTVVKNGQQEGAQKPGAVNPLGSSGRPILASEKHGNEWPHQTDQQAFGTDCLTDSVSGFPDQWGIQSLSPQMMDSGPLGPFSGFSQPIVTSASNTAVGAAPLQTERPSDVAEPHGPPAAQVTEAPKAPSEPLAAMTPKNPLDMPAGVFGDYWSDEAGIPSDLPFTPSVSTVISRHATHLAESPHDMPDTMWFPRDSGMGEGDEREGDESDRKKEKKKKKRKPRDELYDFHTEKQSDSVLSESPHQSSPRKERDRDGGWEDVGRIGGRGKKPKSRKKIPEEWAIHAEPFVPASASMSVEFGTDFTSSPLGGDSGLVSLSEDYTDESLIPLSLTQDLLSFTATSPTSTVQPAASSPKSPSHASGLSPQHHLSISSGFHDIIMETDGTYLADPLACSINDTQPFMSTGGTFEEAMFVQEQSFTTSTMEAQGVVESPVKEPQVSTPGSTCFVPPMEALISAPPFSPSGPAWSLNNHSQSFDLSGMEGVSFETHVPIPASPPSPKRKTPKESKTKSGKKSHPTSIKSPKSPNAKNSDLNPAAPPFFPSFAEPQEHGAGLAITLEAGNSEKNKPEVNKMDDVQKFDNFDVFNKKDKDHKMVTVEQKDKSDHTDKEEKAETLDKNKETDKSEKLDKVETPVKVEKIEKMDQMEKNIKDEPEKVEKTHQLEKTIKDEPEKVEKTHQLEKTIKDEPEKVEKTHQLEKTIKDEPEKVEKTHQLEKTIKDEPEKVEKTHQLEKTIKDEPEKVEKTHQLEKTIKDEPEKVEKTHQLEKTIKDEPEKVEKTHQLEETIKDEPEKVEKVEKTTDKKETAEKMDSSPKVDINEKIGHIEKPALETEIVKVKENKSDLKTEQDKVEKDKLDVKQEKEKVEKDKTEQKTEKDKMDKEVEQKAEKVESAGKKVEKDNKAEKAKKPAAKPSAPKLAVTNGAPGKDLTSPDKKTKPVAGATKLSSAKPRPSSASNATAAPKRPTPTSATSASAPIKKAPVPKAPTPAASTKGPATASTRPTTTTSTSRSSTVAREVKPKTATEKRPPVPKATAAPARPAAPKNSSSATAENKPATTTRTTASAPTARRLTTKTESKPGEEKKPSALKTAVSDAARSKSTPLKTSTTLSSATTRPRATKAPASFSSTSAAAAPEKKPLVPRTTRLNSTTTSTTTRPGSAPAPDIKNIRSKIGSTDNIKHQPGGGKVQILNKKVDMSKVTAKCGSKSNIKHKPGGGEIKIESHKVNFKDKAQSKVGSMDNVCHEPGGGNVKAEGAQETAEGSGAPSSGVSAAQPTASPAQENGLKEGAPCRSEELRDPQGLDSLIPETSI